MARYPLNLPAILKQEAEKLAANQGVSLNQFIRWAVAEKVGNLRQELGDPWSRANIPFNVMYGDVPRYIPVDMKYMETLAVRRRRGEAFGSATDLWSERLALAEKCLPALGCPNASPLRLTPTPYSLLPTAYSLASLRAFVSLW